MKIRTKSAALAAALVVALPVAGFAQEAGDAKAMKGPPNANGYGKEKMGDTVVDGKTDNGKAQDGKAMKGPPNANGYDKGK